MGVCYSSTADPLYLNGFRSCISTLAIQHGLLGTHMRPEGGRGNGFVHCLCKADVALDVGQCLELGCKLLELSQAPLCCLRAAYSLNILFDWSSWRCLFRSTFSTDRQLTQLPLLLPASMSGCHHPFHSGVRPNALAKREHISATGRSRSREWLHAVARRPGMLAGGHLGGLVV